MINKKLVTLITENITSKHLNIFISVMSTLAVLFESFQHYPMFWGLFPLLVIMLVSVVLIIRRCLNEIKQFENDNQNNILIRTCCSNMSSDEWSILNRVLVIFYFAMIFGYFYCLYKLNFYEFDFMGIYIILVGGVTFLLALSGYEIHIKLAVLLIKIEKELSEKENKFKYFQLYYPMDYLFQLHKLLKKASMTISILFVVENSMLFYANYKDHIQPRMEKANDFLLTLKTLPKEWWVIWIYIFVTILIILPLVTYLQNKNLIKIVYYIQTQFISNITHKFSYAELCDNPQEFYYVANSISLVEKNIKESYYPRNQEKIAEFGAALLTCIAHLISFTLIFAEYFIDK